ncbi:MAG: bifunctional UDP-N-acetylglucosamine diphosphorylase/glucosamine-1-phosphate N-acetyltransferase GlmU [Tetrasphaera sp.]|nr:bifunctional UDP-N-acetylglucosamine diphosphorylase/glucosamine-1-phosphate N-acetyltransferase GlmU [Tetrasphaera sp.]
MTGSTPAAVVILAAGEGTRMKSATPKVLHRIGGRSLLGHAIAAARATGPLHLAVVVRHERDLVAAHVADVDPGALIADQDEIKGTGRAAECALEHLPRDLTGTVLVTYGDVPLLTGDTLRGLLDSHRESRSAITVMTAEAPDPTGYGRILRDDSGAVVGIVEHKDADERQRAIREINSGIYAFDAATLRDALARVGTDNAQGEKYLTDVLGVARADGRRVSAYPCDDVWQTEGVNDRVQLATLGRILNERQTQRWMRAGVTIVDPATTWIDVDVTIGMDTTLLPATQVLGATTIGRDAVIGPEVTIRDSEIGDGAQVRRAEVHLARVGAGASVGPYSYLRPGTDLGAGGKIGGFVETKNARIGEGAKVPHLTYCGDATIGAGANIGAGTIFANYDGVAKHTTVIGAQSFVGSNSVLIAPVTVGAGAYVAAGSALVADVHPGQIAVARAKQRNIDGWVDRARPGTATAEAARAATRHTGDSGDAAREGA